MVLIDGPYISFLLLSWSGFIGQGKENRNQMIARPGPQTLAELSYQACGLPGRILIWDSPSLHPGIIIWTNEPFLTHEFIYTNLSIVHSFICSLKHTEITLETSLSEPSKSLGFSCSLHCSATRSSLLQCSRSFSCPHQQCSCIFRPEHNLLHMTCNT